jgi:hypothetical protein
MNQLPVTDDASVLRTDYTDPNVWQAICEEIRQPVGPLNFEAHVEFIDDAEYQGIAKDQILGLIPADYPHSYIIVVDAVTISHPDHPLLVIDLQSEPGRDFRALPAQIQAIDNNLSIANMDFEEFADAVDEDGVFRGFDEG